MVLPLTKIHGLQHFPVNRSKKNMLMSDTTLNTGAWQRYHSHNWEQDEQWRQYFANLTIPETATNTQRQGIEEKYRRKYFSQRVAPLTEYKVLYDLVEVPAKSKHTATIFFFHGLGDTGNGWKSTFDHLSKEFPYIRVVLPSALRMSVTLNYGQKMPAWFDLKGLSVESEEDSVGFQETIKNVRDMIQRENDEYNIPYERILIGGFSQGGSIALYAGLTFEKKLAGIIGLSTFLIQREAFEGLLKTSSANLDTPTFLCHGTADQVVRFAWGRMTKDGIKKALESITGKSDNVIFKQYTGLGHNASPEELEDIIAFIHERLPPV